MRRVLRNIFVIEDINIDHKIVRALEEIENPNNGLIPVFSELLVDFLPKAT